MPVALPLAPSIPNQRVTTSLLGTTYIVDLRWNAYSQAWFMDLLDDQASEIWTGRKIVLGAAIGGRCKDVRAPQGVFFAEDTTNSGTEAGLDDLGTRVLVHFIEVEAA